MNSENLLAKSTIGHSQKPSVRAVARNLWHLWKPGPRNMVMPDHPNETYRMDLPRRPLGIKPQCDIYLPRNESSHGASVLLVHGGGFVMGSKRMKPMRLLARDLVSEGYAVCSIDYRMAFRGGRLPEGVSDVVRATRFWRERSKQLGLNPERIALMGLSAGATLALMALNEDKLDGDIDRVISVFGLYDLELLRGVLAGTISTLSVNSRKPSVQRAHSPIHAPQTALPMLLMHGSGDGLVPVSQAERMKAQRDALSLPTELVIYPDQPHGFFSTQTETSVRAVEDVLGFLGRSL